jgi:hypothetical protein
VAAVTHCFTLGWLTMTIFGALYQLLPVALGTAIRSERVGHVSFWTFAPGVAIFAAGIATSSRLLRNVGLVLITIGIVCLVANVARSLMHAKSRDVTWTAIAAGLAMLLLTVGIGAILAHNIRTNALGEARVRVLTTHLHVALIGWVLVMIVGISHRLLPMFLLAHNADTRWTRRALGCLVLGVAILGAGLPNGTALYIWTGLVLVEAGIACFLTQSWRFYKARLRPRLDAGLHHVGLALLFLTISAGLAPFVLVAGVMHRRLATLYIAVGLLGGLALYVVGQFYKIVPFLVWIARFRHRVGKESVPTVAALYSSRLAYAGLALFTAGITGIALGIATGTTVTTRLGAMLFCAATVSFVGQMARLTFTTS